MRAGLRQAALVVLACLPLALSGCVEYGSGQDACQGVTCLGHGACSLLGDAASCTCEAGYELDPADPLACLATAASSIVVDLVTALTDPVDQVVSASLKNHPAVSLTIGSPMSDLHRDILAFSLQYEDPVYLELDPARLPQERWVLEVRHTLVSPVAQLRPTDDGVEVLLVWSAAVHFLYSTQPSYDAWLALLEAALADGANVVITEKDGQGIIDVRPDAF
jgi:hypothetical protein